MIKIFVQVPAQTALSAPRGCQAAGVFPMAFNLFLVRCGEIDI